MRRNKLLMLILMSVTLLGCFSLTSCDTTVNPLFVRIEEKVSIELNYGYDGIAEKIEIKKNSAYTPKKVERTGYRFVGWYFDSNFSQAFITGSTVSSNISLYAKWEAIELVTVNYLVDGKDYATTTFEKGGTSIKIPNPHKEGYIFIGWYLGEEPFDADNVLSNVTVEAKFSIKVFKISFDLAGGTVDYLPEQATYNSNITLPAPTKQGYSFKEYVDGDGKKYAVGEEVTILKEMSFKAIFEEIIYVRVILNFKDGRNDVIDEIVQNFSYQTPTPERTGYQFAGWYLDEMFLTPFVTGSEVASNITLYAKWDINKYKVIIDANGGTIFDEVYMVIENVYYGTTIDEFLMNVKATRDNYEAVGFSLTKDGKALTMDEMFETKITEDTTIYVVWAKKN